MKKLLLLSLVIALPVFAAEEACLTKWGYEPSNGPDRWAQLDSAWAACDGKQQSPVDLGKAEKRDFAVLIDFQDAPLIVQNTGHDLKVPVGAGLVVTNRSEGTLQQFHFHVKSEHRMNDVQAEGELHLVSETKDKKLIVIAVLIDEGKEENAALKAILALRPETDCTSRKQLTPNFNPMRLLPPKPPTGERPIFMYDGSLTTPACSEIVTFIVLRDHISATRAQLDQLKVHHENARPTQPLGTRTVWKNF